MADKIKAAFDDVEVELKGGGKGDFVVICDGVEVWNKLSMENQFPDEDALVADMAS